MGSSIVFGGVWVAEPPTARRGDVTGGPSRVTIQAVRNFTGTRYLRLLWFQWVLAAAVMIFLAIVGASWVLIAVLAVFLVYTVG